jgi:hypothetical protein
MHRKKTPDPKENEASHELKNNPRKKIKQLQDESLKNNLISSDVSQQCSVYIITRMMKM